MRALGALRVLGPMEPDGGPVNLLSGRPIGPMARMALITPSRSRVSAVFQKSKEKLAGVNEVNGVPA